MIAVPLLLAVLAPATQLPKLDVALAEVERYRAGGSGAAVGAVSLSGFNSHRVLDLGPKGQALVISTLWDSGIFLYGANGAPLGFVATGEIMRVWTVDLDQDGTLEMLTDERVGRGTGFQLYEFRLYTAGRGLKRAWRAERYRLEANQGIQFERRSFVRVHRVPPWLEYRRPCGADQCIQRLALEAGAVRDISAGPSNNELQRTRPAQAMEPRR
jgi:hypothetical protein